MRQSRFSSHTPLDFFEDDAEDNSLTQPTVEAGPSTQKVSILKESLSTERENCRYETC